MFRQGTRPDLTAPSQSPGKRQSWRGAGLRLGLVPLDTLCGFSFVRGVVSPV